MRQIVSRVFFFGISYVLVVINIMYFSKNINLSQIYTNFGIFGLCLFSSSILIFDNCEKIVNKRIYLKETIIRIIKINWMTVLFVSIVNFILYLLIKNKMDILEIVLYSSQLFMILNTISLFIIIGRFNLTDNSEYNEMNIYIFIIISYIIFLFEYFYNKNIMFINLYRYYIYGSNLYTLLFHYIIWIIIPIIIIHKCYKKLK